MRVVGFLAGVGSLLRAAQDEGWEVVGNVDPRPPFAGAMSWLWDVNFPGLPYLRSRDELGESWYDADLAIGHPPCGSHSNLGDTYSMDMDAEERDEARHRRREDLGLLPEFCRLVQRFRPKIFAFDNLWKIVDPDDGVTPPKWWLRQLPNYQLSFWHIVNWDYGCVQRRDRLWLIGTHQDVPWFRFQPIQRRPKRAPVNVMQALDGLPIDPTEDVPEIGHVHLSPDAKLWDAYWTTDDPPERLYTVAEVAEGFMNYREGSNWLYRSQSGRLIKKPGHARLHSQRPCRVLTRTPSLFHPKTGWPLTPRERARLMGWPDDFKLTDGREIDRSLMYKLAEVTGKAVPSEFPRYLIRQIGEHLARRYVAA